MYHTDETHFYQPDDSKVTGRLLKEKSKLTFVDVLIKISIACLLKEVKNCLFSFRHSYTAFVVTVQKIITYALVQL